MGEEVRAIAAAWPSENEEDLWPGEFQVLWILSGWRCMTEDSPQPMQNIPLLKCYLKIKFLAVTSIIRGNYKNNRELN